MKQYAPKVKPIWVKRWRMDEPESTSELRFLCKGDLFWFEQGGKPAPLPEAACKFSRAKGLFFVATSGPIYAREKSGVKRFLGIKFRAAFDTELRLMAYSGS